jgi:hypothetical protein
MQPLAIRLGSSSDHLDSQRERFETRLPSDRVSPPSLSVVVRTTSRSRRIFSVRLEQSLFDEPNRAILAAKRQLREQAVERFDKSADGRQR